MQRLLNAALLPMLAACATTSACDRVAAGYADKDTMYVVCPDLPDMPDADAAGTVVRIMDQYTGPPDEIIVLFVAAPELVGQAEDALDDAGLTGYYYTHSNELVIRPKSGTDRRVVTVTR